MTVNELALYYSIIHGLRSQGWSRIEAEGEALERVVGWRTKNERDNSVKTSSENGSNA